MTRRYVDELCARYNAARIRTDVEWFVDNAGNLRLGDAPDVARETTKRKERTDETERARWMRNHLNRPAVEPA